MRAQNQDMINILDHMLVQYKNGDNLEECLINTIFPSLRENASSSKYKLVKIYISRNVLFLQQQTNLLI